MWLFLQTNSVFLETSLIQTNTKVAGTILTQTLQTLSDSEKQPFAKQEQISDSSA